LGALSARRSDFVKDDGSGDHALRALHRWLNCRQAWPQEPAGQDGPRPLAGVGMFQGTANLLAAVFVIPLSYQSGPKGGLTAPMSDINMAIERT